MEVVELRTLDGPNLFLLAPAIKLEFSAGPRDRPSTISQLVLTDGCPVEGRGPLAIARVLRRLIGHIHRRAGFEPVETVVRELEEPGHVVVAFGWNRREAAREIARLAWRLVSGEAMDIDQELDRIRALATGNPQPEDLPEMLANADRHVPVIGITGTNGKTTTTRLIASIMRRAGKRVGWTSSVGVMIGTEMVLPGDYTGPSGAHRVFAEPNIDIAVLETARGGILLRGLGYAHNDVSVVTNISADHMGMHGVHTLEMLAEVKAVVARVTLPSGRVVLNADDDRVLAMRRVVDAPVVLFGRLDAAGEIERHVGDGGEAIRCRDGIVTWHHEGVAESLVAIDDVPITFGGRAHHMVENALAAAAACLAAGLSIDEVRDGLKAFRNRPEDNRGRLNIFELNGATIVIDFAHNEAGLEQLLTFSRSFCGAGGRLLAVIGTAGDREDSAIEGLGRIAARLADVIIVKDSEKYLRGREPGEMPVLLRRGTGDRVEHLCSNERAAFHTGISEVGQGDVLAVMCIEDIDEILGFLGEHATPIS